MHKLEERTDEELVKEVLAGNDDVFLLIMQRYEQKLMRYLRRLLSLAEADLEDVLQDVFIKVYQNLNAFSLKLKFSSWIYRITRNEAISSYRKFKNRPKTYDLDVDMDMNLLENLVAGVDLKEDFDKELLRKEIAVLLEELDRKYKDVLLLRFLEDKDYQEISDILKIPMGTVATLLNRAKKKFKHILLDKNLIKHYE